MVTNEQVKQALARLYTLHNTDVDLGLERVKTLLSKLGDPHLKTPPIVHVAGTNGKGSTISFMRSVLNKAGYSCHVYTSPNLIDFKERIRLADKLISNDELLSYIQHIEAVNDGAVITFFEITTVLAFYAFSKVKADILLLEVGLGGRLDATNVIDHALLNIITPIGMDHMDYLGCTIEEIAGEKAAIIKNGARVVLAKQRHAQAADVIKKYAQSRGATLIQLETLPYNIEIGMLGAHQYDNATTALTAIKALAPKFDISDEHIKAGLKEAFWPGRFQKLAKGGDLVQSMPSSVGHVYVDGGHNMDAIEAQKTVLKDWQTQGYKISAVIAIKEDKDYAAYLKAIQPYCDQMIFVPLNNQMKGVEPALMQAVIPTATVCDCLENAVKKVKNDLCLITGSLFLVGEALALNDEEVS